VTARTRVYAGVALAAAAAAAIAVGGAVGTRQHREGTVKPRAGRPPLELDVGIRDDRYARTLRRVQSLYDAKRYDDAKKLVENDPKLEPRVAYLFATWPDSLPAIEKLGRDHVRDSFVNLHLGLARYWAGDNQGAVAAWSRADRVQPDTMSALRAEDLLHPSYFPGHPAFVPGFAFPAALARLAPPAQFRQLQRRAASGDARAKLLFGVALQRLGKPLSARRVYDAAARQAPADPEPAVAAAVARFDKSNLSAAFSRLGPLSRRFPHAPTVRFHLGLLLLWVGQVPEAKRQLKLAAAAGPTTTLGREAKRFLSRLESSGTG
jgi:tetratricopeptide (TPR) repeat protein